MKNDEYYRSEEFSRGAKEYKEFTAEVYAKTTDYTPTAPEIGKTAAEYSVATDATATGAASDGVKEKRKTAREKSKKFLDKLHGSTHAASGVGTVAGAVGTVAVAATVVVGVVDVFPNPEPLPPPVYEMAYLLTAADCMQYDLFLSEPVDGVEYSVVIYGDDGTHAKFAVEVGRNRQIVSNLSPNTQYTLELVGTSKSEGHSTTCHQEEFTTRDVTYRTAFFDVDEVITDGAATLDYAVYVSDFARTDGQYAMRVLYEGAEYTEDAAIAEDGYFYGNVSDLVEGEYTFTVVDVQSAEEEVISSYSHIYLYGEGQALAPEITLAETPVLQTDNRIQIPFSVVGSPTAWEYYGTLRVDARYDTGETEEIVLEDVLLNGEDAFYLENVPVGAQAVTLTAEYEYFSADGWTNVGKLEAQEFALPSLRLVAATVDTQNGDAVTFSFATRGDTTAFVVAEDGTEYEAVDGLVNFTLTGTGTYEYGARDASGAETVARQSLTLQTGVTSTYDFNYKNPGDVVKTYNNDGTFNIYIVTDFASDDQEVYYEVVYDSSETQNSGALSSRETVWALEDAPIGLYSLVYNVYKETAGVRYLLQTIAVSGDTGSVYSGTSVEITPTATETGKTLEVRFRVLDAYEEYDLREVGLRTDDGTVFSWTESDFTLTEDGAFYRVTVDVGVDVQWATLSVMANGNLMYYEDVVALREVKGEKFTWVNLEYYVA